MNQKILPTPQIVARYKRGDRLQDMAVEYGVHYATLLKRVKDAGYVNKPGRKKGQRSGPKDLDKLKEMRAMRRKKMTYQQIGAHFGMTRQAVQQYLRNHLATKTES
jgi:hypothetical protein